MDEEENRKYEMNMARAHDAPVEEKKEAPKPQVMVKKAHKPVV